MYKLKMLYMMTVPNCWFSYRKTKVLAISSSIASWWQTWWQCENVGFTIGKYTFWHCHHVLPQVGRHDGRAKLLVFLYENKGFRNIKPSPQNGIRFEPQAPKQWPIWAPSRHLGIVIMYSLKMATPNVLFSYRKTNDLAELSCLASWWQCENDGFTVGNGTTTKKRFCGATLYWCKSDDFGVCMLERCMKVLVSHYESDNL